MTAHHHWHPTEPFAGNRLITGSAGFAPTTGVVAGEWSMYLRDSMRSSWCSSQINPDAQIAWTYNAFAKNDADCSIRSLKNTQSKERRDPLPQ